MLQILFLEIHTHAPTRKGPAMNLQHDRPFAEGRLDKYGAVAETPTPYDEDARERLLAKLDRAAARLGIALGYRCGKTDGREPGRRGQGTGFRDKKFGGGRLGFGGDVSPGNPTKPPRLSFFNPWRKKA
jgi:hypothetical protein